MEALVIMGLLVAVLAFWAGKVAERTNNGAMAVCVQCEHTTPRSALHTAVSRAKKHKAETGHQCMVVKS